MLLKGLYRNQMLNVISKYSARFLKQPISEAGDPQKTDAVTAALLAVGATISHVDFSQRLNAVWGYNAEVQDANTNQQLEIEMKRMRDDGVVELLKEDMPFQCMIIEHSDVFLALLKTH